MDLAHKFRTAASGMRTGLLITVIAALAIVFVPAWLIPFLQGPDPGECKAFLCSPALVAVVSTGPPLDIHRSGGNSLARRLALGPSARAGRRGPSRRRSYVVCTAESLRVDVQAAGQSSFSGAAQNHFIGDHDMVMALAIDGDAVAYPVRQIAYHHVVQDTVGGVPLVATY